MTDQLSHYTPTDEQLVAFLDDEVDTEERGRIEAALARDESVAERLEWLMRSDLPFQEAYGELLEQAPQARLEAMLHNLPTEKKAADADESAQFPRRGRQLHGRGNCRGSTVPGLADTRAVERNQLAWAGGRLYGAVHGADPGEPAGRRRHSPGPVAKCPAAPRLGA